MISTNPFSINWAHFDDINPDKQEAFEKLCRSLFQRTKIAEGQILHSDPNNPGVEVIPVKSKDRNKMISFQAKYFDSSIGYKKIEASMKTAITYYAGKLDIIYLYCNKDIDSSSKTYKNIESVVSNVGIEIVLVTGQSILEEAMIFPEVLVCYFGMINLGIKWFDRNLQIALDNLGRRYNTLFNVETESKKQLSLFLKNSDGIAILNNKKVEIIDELKRLRYRCEGEFSDFVKKIISSIRILPDVTEKNISMALRWKEEFDRNNTVVLDELSKLEQTYQTKAISANLDSKEYEEIQSKLYTIERIKYVSNGLELKEYEKRLVTSSVVFVTGEMGTGKSQLLATSAKNELSRGRLSLLLLGQTFMSNENIENQIMKSLNDIPNGTSFESLLDTMEENAYVNQEYAIVFIDAINESHYRNIWKEGLNQIIAAIENRKRILLVVSVRSGFEQLMYSEKIVSDLDKGELASIVHKGFLDESPKAIFEFLSNNGVPISPEYYLRHEMNNPLFLTWFCQTYSDEDKGLDSLIANVINIVDREASTEAGFSEPLRALDGILDEFMDVNKNGPVSRKAVLGLKAWDLYGISNKIAYINAIERAGVLTTFVIKQEEFCCVGYNLLEDYLRAKWIIKKLDDREQIKQYCLTNLFGIDLDGKQTIYGNESVFAMVAALYANEYEEECLDVFDSIADDFDRSWIINEYLKAFVWRNPRISLEDFIGFISKYCVDAKTVWDIFIECAAKEKSVFNADGLFKVLNRYKLNIRDHLWTIYINGLSEDDRVINLAYYLEAGNVMSDLSDKSTENLIILYSWMLSSSNRVLRDRISKAMVEVLKNHFNICAKIISRFKNVNDPYIVQRLYGIVWGAVMKRTNLSEAEFEKLALMVYSEVFLSEKVYPDILLRDYARLIVERFLFEYPNKNNLIEKKRIIPPYASDPIPKTKEVDYSDEKYRTDGLWRLLFSMKFDLNVNGVGMYGDFGRYVFQSSLRYFKNVDARNIYYYALGYIINDLGYSNELFGEYDTRFADFDRHHVKGIERIGKKYEWIAMYNILARLSDCSNVVGNDWNDESGKAYEGPWNPYVRDFDPTLNVRYMIDQSVFPKFEDCEKEDKRFIEKDATDEEIDKWVISDDELFSSFPKRFIRRDVSGKEWVSMYSDREVKNQISRAEDMVFSFPRGEQHIWVTTSMHFADATQKLTINRLEESKYINQNFGMNATQDCYSLYSREYAWSPGYMSEFDESTNSDDECLVKASSAVINAMWEEQYDASQEQTTSYHIPTGQIIRELGMYQKQYDGTFYFEDEIVAFDTRILGAENGELLIRRDMLDEFIRRKGIITFWNVVGEKQFFLGKNNQKWKRREGYYIYTPTKVHGRIRIVYD